MRPLMPGVADAGNVRAPADLRQWPFCAGFVAVAKSAGQATDRQPRSGPTPHPELIEPHLERPGPEQHPFAALNGAFWEDGAFIYLPRGTVVETPIHLIFHCDRR
jgi:hypothetical protein